MFQQNSFFVLAFVVKGHGIFLTLIIMARQLKIMCQIAQ